VTTRGRRLARRYLPSGLLALAVWAATASGAQHLASSPAGVAAASRSPAASPAAAGTDLQDAPEEDGGAFPWRGQPAGGARQPEPSAPTDAAWTPATPLPAAESSRRHIDVVLSPHPDDETLSLGVWTANAVARGDRVIVVALTDGRTTGARKPIELRLGHALTQSDIAVARIAEMRAAVADLGVAASDLYLAHLDDPAGPGRAWVTEPEAAAVIKAFAERFPGATFATMSWVAERQLDHLSAGRALWSAVRDGTVHDGLFAVSRLWWSLPCPAVTQVLPGSAEVRRRLLAAAAAYDRWDPAESRYAVGWTSVHPQFVALLADPHDRVHGWSASSSVLNPQP
jgi:LmbE family N-acetylglucosaminyl deacetylase